MRPPAQEWHEGMSERDNRREDLEPGDEEFEDELEAGPEEEEELEEIEEERPSRRGRHDEEAPHRGSLRESHERVHVDDRPSAIFAILAALALLGALAIGLVANWVPAPAVPTLTPLIVPTVQAQSAAPSATLTPTVAPTATPTAAPSVSAAATN
jgi:hypothetical protein